MIPFTCPHCSHTLNIPSQFAGKSGTCNRCKGRITVPATDPSLEGAVQSLVSGLPEPNLDLTDLSAARLEVMDLGPSTFGRSSTPRVDKQPREAKPERPWREALSDFREWHWSIWLILGGIPVSLLGSPFGLALTIAGVFYYWCFGRDVSEGWLDNAYLAPVWATTALFVVPFLVLSVLLRSLSGFTYLELRDYLLPADDGPGLVEGVGQFLPSEREVTESAMQNAPLRRQLPLAFAFAIGSPLIGLLHVPIFMAVSAFIVVMLLLIALPGLLINALWQQGGCFGKGCVIVFTGASGGLGTLIVLFLMAVPAGTVGLATKIVLDQWGVEGIQLPEVLERKSR